MKKMPILLLVSLLMMVSSITEAQRRTITFRTEPQDSGYIKSQIYKYDRMAHTGVITMIVGGSVTLIGGVMTIALSNATPDDAMIWGYITAGAGVATAITGAIIWGTGRGRAGEYQIRLDNMKTALFVKPQYYITPQYSGIALAVRF